MVKSLDIFRLSIVVSKRLTSVGFWSKVETQKEKLKSKGFKCYTQPKLAWGKTRSKTSCLRDMIVVIQNKKCTSEIESIFEY